MLLFSSPADFMLPVEREALRSFCCAAAAFCLACSASALDCFTCHSAKLTVKEFHCRIPAGISDEAYLELLRGSD